MHDMTNQQQNPDDQSWDVFRYVAGEMSSDEETQFEQQLEHDQALREEVAGMVGMLAMVDQSQPAVKVSLPDRSRAANFRLRRILVSVAAVALLATLAVALMPKPELSDSNAESVAIAWAESLDADEFDLPVQDDDFEFASLDFNGDDDWIAEAVGATSANTDEPFIN